eukprot:TRINITY_DN2096_c0_g2_i6.p1 TRINITY_DN2096_c0_g2~~TRINITY_DN2096_c0_g2_i6.p1  ORF type:complete len:287 (-),score=84.96 TRINITY_DN2096_c0_g2_i6:54-914(-)
MAIIPSFVIYRIYFTPYKHVVVRDIAAKLFLFGMLSVIPAALVELGLQLLIGTNSSRVLMGFVNGFIVAGLTEEVTKYVTIYFSTKPLQAQSKYAGTLYGLMAAMGFATVENVGYVVFQGSAGGIVGVLFLGTIRALLAVPMHCITGMFLGTKIYERKMDRDPVTGKQKPHIDLLAPIFLHGLYDAILFSMSDPKDPTMSFIGIGLVVFLMIVVCIGFNWKFIPYAREGVSRDGIVNGNTLLGNQYQQPQHQMQQQGQSFGQQPLMSTPVQPVTAQPVQYAGDNNV